MLICQNANVNESTCIAETYESSSLPVSCVFTSAQVDGGTCVSATPSDQDAANLACGAASSSRYSCLSATYVDSLMEKITRMHTRTPTLEHRYEADISSGVDFLSCTTTTNVAIARESCRAKIESGLEDLPLQVVRDVDVRDVTPEDLSTSVYTHETMKFDVYFVDNSGDLPDLQSLGNAEFAAYVTIQEKVKGTTENLPCSNRGICDYTTGMCQCFQGFTKHDCSKQNALAMY